jgi:hypothetical protein
MALKWWLRVGLLSMFLLAGCKQSTPTPSSTQASTPGSAYPAYPPTATSAPVSYPAPGTTATAVPPNTVPAPTSGPYPAPTSGAVAHLVPL